MAGVYPVNLSSAPVLTYNSGTQTYDGTVEVPVQYMGNGQAGPGAMYMKFYNQTKGLYYGEVAPSGIATAASLSFRDDNERSGVAFSSNADISKVGGFYVFYGPRTPGTDQAVKLNVSVSLSSNTASFKLVEGIASYPCMQLCSPTLLSSGTLSTSVVSTALNTLFTPSKENPQILECVTYVPSAADMPPGLHLFLSPQLSISSLTAANYCVAEEATVALAEGQVYQTTLVEGVGKYDIKYLTLTTPGYTRMTFNTVTKEFTAELYTEKKAEAGDDVVYVARNNLAITPLPSATDDFLSPTGTPGIYAGELSFDLTKPFNFYTKSGNTTVWYGSDTSDALVPMFISAVDFTDGVCTQSLTEGSRHFWVFYGSFPEGCEGQFNVTVDLNTNTATFTPISVGPPVAPEQVYVWASYQGPLEMRYFKNVATMKPSAANPAIYNVEMVVPDCGEFYIDPETDDKGTGMYFLLSDSEEGFLGKGIRMFMANIEPEGNNIIEITAGETATVDMVEGNIGTSLICKSIGLVDFTFDWDNMTLTASMEDPDYDESNYIYVATKNGYYGEFPVTASDPSLRLNPTTGWFEGTTITLPKNYAFKFYRKTDDGVEWIAPLSRTVVNFALANPYTGTYEEGSSSWQVTNFFNADATEGEIDLAINPETYEVKFTQTDAKEEIPEAVYIWGGMTDIEEETGSYSVIGTMTPVEGQTKVYEATIDVPESTPMLKFNFFLSLNKDSFKDTNRNFNAPYTDVVSGGGSDQSGNPPVVKFDSDDMYVVTLYKGTLSPDGTSPLSSITDEYAGPTTFIFNLDTQVLTVTQKEDVGGGDEPPTPETPNKVYFDFGGIENAYSCVTVYDNETNENLTVAGPTMTFEYMEEGSVTFGLTPSAIESGYTYTVACTETPGADIYTLGAKTETEGKIQQTLTVYPGANGYRFTVNVEKKPDQSGILNIFDLEGADGYTVSNLQGMVILRNAGREALRQLQPGLYIVNGKKLIVR